MVWPPPRVSSISPAARLAGLAAFTAAVAVAALGLVAVARTPAPARPESAAPRVPAGETVELQLLGVNDFHGQLEPPKSVPRKPGGRPVPLGGAPALAAHLDRAERSHPGRTIRVNAGDMWGASPLLSSHFHDEPAVAAMNLMRFDVGTLGNHELDEGADEAARLLRGGRRNDGRQFKRDRSGELVDTSTDSFGGVKFRYLAANLEDREGELSLPPTAIVERAGVRVGFIGVTTPSAPDYLLAETARRLRYADISTVVNARTRELQRQGVEAIVVLAHAGARADERSGRVEGEILDEARQMTAAVDVVIAGHTHAGLNVRVANPDGGDKLVVQAKALGVAFDRVRLRINRRSGDVVAKEGTTQPTWNDEVRPDPRLAELLGRYRRRVAPLARRVVGRALSELRRERPGALAGSIGTVAARAQRLLAGTEIAFVNEGNARADVGRGPVTFADLFAASAYEQPVVRMTLSGRQVRRIVARQFELRPPVLLHIAGLRYVRRQDRVAEIALADGRPLDPDRRYTVAATRMLIDGAGFETLRAGRGARSVGTDLEALVSYVRRVRVVR